MNFINEKIQHRKYGEGTVISQVKDIISVEFSDEFGVKQFVYPDAFEAFLKFSNPDLEISVLNELHEKQANIEELRLQKRKEEEEKKQRELELVKTQKKKTASRKKKAI